jgi:hypothetical protein
MKENVTKKGARKGVVPSVAKSEGVDIAVRRHATLS